jgi:hypothetical protein
VENFATACQENSFKYMRIKEQHLAESQFFDPVTIGGKVYPKLSHWN